jgi:hypothetical protein
MKTTVSLYCWQEKRRGHINLHSNLVKSTRYTILSYLLTQLVYLRHSTFSWGSQVTLVPVPNTTSIDHHHYHYPLLSLLHFITMSVSAPPEAIYPDIATGFAAIHAHAKEHGYAIFQRDTVIGNMYCGTGIPSTGSEMLAWSRMGFPSS